MTFVPSGNFIAPLWISIRREYLCVTNDTIDADSLKSKCTRLEPISLRKCIYADLDSAVRLLQLPFVAIWLVFEWPSFPNYWLCATFVTTGKNEKVIECDLAAQLQKDRTFRVYKNADSCYSADARIKKTLNDTTYFTDPVIK